MENQLLARIIHGAHLFGLGTADSDQDYKSVILPSADRILLGNSDFSTDEGSTSDDSRKNTSADIDDKKYSLSMFLRLCASNALDALEMINAPLEFHVVEPHPIFLELRRQKDRLSNRNVGKIISFCRSQALTYGPREDRYAAALTARDTLLALGVTEVSKTRTGEYSEQVVKACASEYVGVKMIPTESGQPLPHLDICGKLVAATSNSGQALIIAAAAAKRYGRQIKNVAPPPLNDWKSISHSLRIAQEGVEYVRTGSITLPVPNRAHLLDIKLGLLPLEQVTEEIDEAIQRLETEAKKSNLPEEADTQFINEFVMATYGAHVIADFDELVSEFDDTMGLKLSTSQSMLRSSGHKIS